MSGPFGCPPADRGEVMEMKISRKDGEIIPTILVTKQG